MDKIDLVSSDSVKSLAVFSNVVLLKMVLVVEVEEEDDAEGGEVERDIESLGVVG